MKATKNCSDITSRYQPVARLDLSYVSQNEGFGNYQTPTWGEGAMVIATAMTAAADEFLGRLQPPSHHAQGFNIPFGHTPHSDLVWDFVILI